jgi:hypothetical protein
VSVDVVVASSSEARDVCDGDLARFVEDDRRTLTLDELWKCGRGGSGQGWSAWPKCLSSCSPLTSTRTKSNRGEHKSYISTIDTGTFKKLC